MKITFLLINHNLSGGNKVIAIYADRLARRGHEVTVVAGRHRNPSFEQKIRSFLKGEGWPVARGDDTHFIGNSARIFQIESHRPVVDGDVPDGDVVVTTWWETAEWARALSPLKGATAYFIQHHEIHPGLDRARVEETYCLPFQKITISNWLKDTMAELYGDPNVPVVHNSVDTAQFHAPPRERNERPTVGLLYSTVYFKCIDDGLAVVEKLRQVQPNLRVVMFGGEEPQRAVPVPSYVEFHARPAQDKIKDIYAQCDVWLCSSSQEGFYLPFTEAMACRCPVVSTRIGGPADMIVNGQNGFLVDVHDVDGLTARALEVLQMPPERWRAMSDAAYATATGYSWDDATALFEKVLLDVAHRPG